MMQINIDLQFKFFYLLKSFKVPMKIIAYNIQKKKKKRERERENKTIYMKYKALFSLKIKIKIKMSSAAPVIGALTIKMSSGNI